MSNRDFGDELNIPPFNGKIHPDYNHPDILEKLSDCKSLLDEPSTRILLEGRNRIGCCRFRMPDGEDEDVVIKEYCIHGINWLKSLLLPSKAFKAWQGSNTLVQKGISTPAPIAYLETRKGMFLDSSYFLSAMLEDVVEVRSLLPVLSGEELEVLLVEVARYLSRFWEEGILHRDLSDGNILVKKRDNGCHDFYIIDTNRIRHKRRLGVLLAVKSLIRLGVPSANQRFFLQEYLQPRRLNNFLWFWYKLNKHTFTGYIGLKKVLRLKKIARKLKIQ
jgi:serine/threonine protein kinase